MREASQVELVEWMVSTGASLNVVQSLAGPLLEQGWTESQINSVFGICPVQIPEGRRWFTDTVTAAIDPGLNRADQAHLLKCIKVHQKWVAENSSLRYEVIDDYDSALHQITKSTLDGPNGTLAQNEMTYNPRTDEIIKCLTRFDAADGLNHATGLHEFCHGDGLPHQEDDPEGLMYTYKNNATFYGQNELDEYGTRYPKLKLA